MDLTISHNAAGGVGGGVYADQSHLIQVYSNLWGNTPDQVYNVDDLTGTDGNISADPVFLDRTAADPLLWDLHLDPASNLVDAGDPSMTDPDTGPADIGAFGGPGADGWDLDQDGYPAWWQPGPYDVSTYPGLGLDCDDLDPTVHPGSGC
jgi:hypothetical protein